MTQKQKQKKLQRKAQKRKKSAIEQQKKEKIRDRQQNIDDQVDIAIQMIQEAAYLKAEMYLKKIAAKYPNESYVLYGIGLLYIKTDKTNKGITYLKKSIQLDPRYVYGYLNLAIAYYKEFYLHKMADILDEMFEKASDDGEAFDIARKQMTDAEEIVQEQNNLSLREYCKGQSIFEEAHQCMIHEAYEDAINLFEESLKITSHTQSYGNMGLCYAKLGQRQLALDNLNKALELDPGYELAAVNKIFVEKLKEGEKLSSKINSVEYYKDYAIQDKSYIKEVVKELAYQE